jgi:general nucleoside transport system permease protein
LIRFEPRGASSRFWSFGSPVLALLLTIIITGALFSAAGIPPALAIYTFMAEPLFAQGGISALLVKAAPLIMIGVGLSLCYRANVWNIGAEGQFILGGICGGGAALAFPDAPAGILYPATIAFGIFGGMLWAAIAAFLRTQFNANEILTSLMLAYVAQLLLIYLVTGPWRDPMGFGFPQTAMFSQAATAPALLAGTHIHLGCAVAPGAAVVVWFVLTKTVLGFQLRAAGEAPKAARFAGYSETGLIWVAMAISGGLAGLAGIFEVTGPIGQLTAKISPGYGFSAIIVAFLGRLHPLGAIFSGLLLALTYLGGDAAQINLRMPNAVTGMFQGILLFSLLGCDILILYRLKHRPPFER